ncbi:MAG TPA: DUF2206 domain-containing protein [Candidatus Saccharimonadales bacterium]|nr:DUF2206 domain-containing protein [Candidatus Saccharimonadales bacterium]
MGIVKTLQWRRWVPGLAIVATWMLTTLVVPSTFVRALVSIGFLALAPGYFAFRSLVGYAKPASLAHLLGYTLGLSLALLMVIGLGVNQLLPLFGNRQPLTTTVLCLAIGGVTAALVVLSAFRARPKRPHLRFRWKELLKAWPFVAPSVVLPVLATGGAITLNNGGSNWLALTAMGGIGLYALFLVWSKKAVRWYPAALYGICLALLLGTSMRGWHITGHDIMQEYQVFELTLRHSAWHMQYYQDAYNACLSITILPTIFQRLTGIADPYVFKFVYQLLFASIAPLLYVMLKKFTDRRIALLAVFTFMSFPAFLTDITMLNRQTIALLFVALSLLAGLDKTLRGWHKRTLGAIFLLGMILSHYSTSYITLSVIGAALVFGYGSTLLLNRFRKRPGPRRKTDVSIYHPAMFAGAVIALFAWGTLATHTSDNIARTITGGVQEIRRIIDHQTSSNSGAGNVSLTAQNNASTDLFAQYLARMKQTRNAPSNAYYPDSTIAKFPMLAKNPAVPAEGSAMRALHVPTQLIGSLFDAVRQGYALLLELLIVAGLAIVALKRAALKSLSPQYLMLGIASLCIIAMQVILPSDVINYGILRVIQQSLLLLALPIVVGLLWIARAARISERWRPRAVALVLVAFFAILSGFVPALTGGFKPTLALSNSGFYYEAYYTHQQEITADQWLLASSPKGSRVYADEFARRKMIAYTNSTIFAQPVLVPSAIPVDSYVYLSSGNTTFDEIPFYYKGDLLYEHVPYNFLNANKNLLYSSGDVLIYK